MKQAHYCLVENVTFTFTQNRRSGWQNIKSLVSNPVNSRQGESFEDHTYLESLDEEETSPALFRDNNNISKSLP